MPDLSRKSLMETGSKLAVVVMATALCSVVILHYGKRKNVGLRKGLTKGQQIPPKQAIDYAASAHTILIILDRDCRSCRDSVQFYQRLHDLSTQKTPPVPVWVMSAESDSQVSHMTGDSRFPFPIINNVTWIEPWSSDFPLVLSVDNKGRIANFWQGDLSADAQDEILAEAQR